MTAVSGTVLCTALLFWTVCTASTLEKPQLAFMRGHLLAYGDMYIHAGDIYIHAKTSALDIHACIESVCCARQMKSIIMKFLEYQRRQRSKKLSARIGT